MTSPQTQNQTASPRDTLPSAVFIFTPVAGVLILVAWGYFAHRRLSQNLDRQGENSYKGDIKCNIKSPAMYEIWTSSLSPSPSHSTLTPPSINSGAGAEVEVSAKMSSPITGVHLHSPIIRNESNHACATKTTATDVHVIPNRIKRILQPFSIQATPTPSNSSAELSLAAFILMPRQRIESHEHQEPHEYHKWTLSEPGLDLSIGTYSARVQVHPASNPALSALHP